MATSLVARAFPLILAGMLSDNDFVDRILLDQDDQRNADDKMLYTIVVDAGSTGSRVHKYAFYGPAYTECDNGSIDKSNPTVNLVGEFYSSTKPGLSAYADDPEKGAETILKLIRERDDYIPDNKKAETPILVRATAGLRLLPMGKATSLLNHVFVALAKLNYKVDLNSVKLLKESDEGIFMWYAVNLLTANFGRNSITTLEMGGGSTQVTHEIPLENISKYPAEDIYVRPAVQNITLYSRSFLGLGLRSAQLGVLKLEAEEPDKPDSVPSYTSVCADPALQQSQMEIFKTKFEVSGASREGLSPEEVFLRCQNKVKQYIDLTMNGQKVEPLMERIAAMGFFYFLAINVKLIDKGKNGEVSTEMFHDKAVEAGGPCAVSNIDSPWLCFEIVYIVTLLQYGFHLPPNKPIALYYKIDNMYVDWSLGLAFYSVMSRLAEKMGSTETTILKLRDLLLNARRRRAMVQLL